MPPQYAKDQPSGYKNHFQKIAFVGVGGQCGKWITQELLKNPRLEITAITRATGGSAIPSGVQHVAKVDYNDETSLVEALRGHDALLITMAVTAPPDTEGKLIAAAARAGVPWILPNEYSYPSLDAVLDRESFVGAVKAKTRAAVEAAGLAWIGIACGFWFEFSLCGGADRFGFDVARRSVRLLGDGDVRLSSSTFAQVGRAVAALLALPLLPEDENDDRPTVESYRNRFVPFASFTLSQSEMWAALRRATATEERDWTVEKVDDVKEFYAENAEKVKIGDRAAFSRALYSRYFFPGEPGNMEKHYGGLQNERLDLPKEDLDEVVREAVKTVPEM